MLTLLTGGCASGKTSWIRGQIRDNTDYNDRIVYVYNGNRLDYPASDNFIFLEDAKKWFRLPRKSVVIFEEPYSAFPARSCNDLPPPWVGSFSVPSHTGIDVFMTAQKPNLIDSAVLESVGRHLHFIRDSGLKSFFEWRKYRSDNVASISCRKTSLICCASV